MVSAERKTGSARILCAGIAVQDIVMRVQNFPPAGGKVKASEFIVTGGGCAANAAVAIARLGGKAAFSGPLGESADEVSNRIVADLTREGIDCSGVVRVAGASASVSLILLDMSGEKTIATRRGAGLADALPDDAEKLVAAADAVLVDNRFPQFVTPICAAARARGIPVVMDLDLATSENDPLLGLCTHVIASAEALRGTAGLDDLGAAMARLAAHVPGFVAVTDGANGTFWLEDGKARHLAAFRVPAIDTLGAGDAFHAAFTLTLAEGRPLTEILRFASAAGALKCTHFGGGAGAPTRAEVEDFLKRHR